MKVNLQFLLRPVGDKQVTLEELYGSGILASEKTKAILVNIKAMRTMPLFAFEPFPTKQKDLTNFQYTDANSNKAQTINLTTVNEYRMVANFPKTQSGDCFFVDQKFVQSFQAKSIGKNYASLDETAEISLNHILLEYAKAMGVVCLEKEMGDEYYEWTETLTPTEVGKLEKLDKMSTNAVKGLFGVVTNRKLKDLNKFTISRLPTGLFIICQQNWTECMGSPFHWMIPTHVSSPRQRTPSPPHSSSSSSTSSSSASSASSASSSSYSSSSSASSALLGLS